MRLSRVITAANRAELVRAVTDAPLGAQFELVDDPRTSAQNRMLWSLLSAIAEQVPLGGEHYDAESWKAAFLKAMGKTLTFMPSLDGSSVVAVGYRSSKLTKAEMADMITMIFAYGDEHGVKFKQDDAA